jgi:threonine dehydrogenase-like Zn-dependent dehydrogenase
MVPCDTSRDDACAPCRAGDYQLCEANLQYGVSMPLALEHGLWGMYGDFILAHPRAITHRIPNHVTVENAIATAFLANAVRWTQVKGKVQRGECVAVFGAGPQGIGSAAVATYRGATPILIGLSADRPRFEIAVRIGVVRPENVVACDQGDIVETVRWLTGGRGCDLSIECSGADPAVGSWLEVLRKRGRAVLSGYHGGRGVTTPVDLISTKELEVCGAWGQAGGWPLAIEMLAKQAFDFAPMITNRYRVDQLNEVIPNLKDPSRITMKAFVEPLPL